MDNACCVTPIWNWFPAKASSSITISFYIANIYRPLSHFLGLPAQVQVQSTMGCRQSSEEKEAARRSRRIDRHLHSESQRQRREIKLLLLGTSNSGKSTIVKQMKIIHSGGFNLEACKEYKPLIIYNAIDSLTRIIRPSPPWRSTSTTPIGLTTQCNYSPSPGLPRARARSRQSSRGWWSACGPIQVCRSAFAAPTSTT